MATIRLETFGPGAAVVSNSTFVSKLKNAVATAVNGTVIDCTGYTGSITMTQNITVTRSVTILLGNITLTFTASGNLNMFNVQAPNVKFIGVSRSNTTNSGETATKFVMPAGRGYHIYAANPTSAVTTSANGLTIENIDFQGVKSTYTSLSGTVNYTYSGAGGIVIAEGNPNQAGSNISNILIKNVHVDSAKHHGIMIYGAITSRLVQCRVRNTAGHGYYITGSSTSVHLDTCYALSTDLAGFCLEGATYSALTTCAADNCSVGYWLRSSRGINLTSCGAEVFIINSNILPNNLGLTLQSTGGAVAINDIGSDNINFFKGTSYLITGGESNSLISCYSKDPGNRAGQTTYANSRTSHITLAGSTTLNRIMTPLFAGTSPVKYKLKLVPIGSSFPDKNIIDYGNFTYDSTNPEPADLQDMLPVADIFNQNNTNVYISFD